MKHIQKVKVKNSLGLHIRPATAIVKLLQNSKSKVFFSFRDMTVNAKSIMSLLILSAQKNATIEICVEGQDATAVMQSLVQGFETKFGEK